MERHESLRQRVQAAQDFEYQRLVARQDQREMECAVERWHFREFFTAIAALTERNASRAAM